MSTAPLPFLSWLAEALANDGLIRRPPPDGIGRGAWEAQRERLGLPAHPGLCFTSTDLGYEPRALAIKAGCAEIALGGKQGRLLRLIRGKEKWTEAEDTEDTDAIRALAYDRDGRLLVGSGLGRLRILSADEPAATREPSGDRSAFVHRYRRLVCVRDNASEILAIGTTEDQLAYVLTKGDALLAMKPGGLLRVADGLERHLLQHWPEGRCVVDGTWTAMTLWLLDDQGEVHAFRASRERVGPHLLKQRVLPPPPERVGERRTYRAISACRAGLLVAHSEGLFLHRLPHSPPGRRFLRRRTRLPPALRRAPAPAPDDADGDPWSWPATRVIDAAVSKPFPDDEVELVVSVLGQGLFRRQVKRDVHEDEQMSLGRRGADQAVDVLRVRYGSEHVNGPIWLITAHRDHHVEVASLLKPGALRDYLDAELPELIESVADGRESMGLKSHLPRLGPGVRWWLIHRIIQQHTFTTPTELTWLDPVALHEALLEGLEAPDLKRLVDALISTWDKQEAPKHKLRELLTGLRWFLRRARALGPEALIDVTQRACEGLSLSKNRAIVIPYHAFFTKWILSGDTYQQKPRGLWRLVEHNRRSGHTLDALTYLTRLMSERVDPQWKATIPGEPSPIWGLAASQERGFIVFSTGAGELRALDLDGRALRWEGSPRGLRVDGEALEPDDAQAFRDRYQHGPYARFVLLHDLGGASLVVFCAKGWRAEDREAADRNQKPTLYALRIRRDRDALRVEGSAQQELESELHGGCVQPGPSKGPVHLVLGTAGKWGDESAPLLQVTVEARSADLEVTVPKPQSIHRRTFGAWSHSPPGPGDNPTWALARFDHGQNTYLAAGEQDGTIRLYRLDDGGWTPLKVHAGVSRASVLLDSTALETSGAVWSLVVHQAKHAEETLLAYGTSTGQYGVLSVKLGQDDSCQVVHVLHSQAAAAVTAVQVYQDELTKEELRPVMAALSQDGALALHNLRDPDPEAEVPRLKGERLDRVSLGLTTRAMVVLRDGSTGGEPPRLLVGQAEGTLTCLDLRLPHGSHRRHEEAKRLTQGSPPDWAGAAGEAARAAPSLRALLAAWQKDDDRAVGGVPSALLAWLQVLSPGGHQLRGFAIFFELNVLRRELEAAEGEAIAPAVDALIDAMRRLGREVAAVRPLNRELAKRVWEQGARAANVLARRRAAEALRKNEDATSEPLLEHYERLNKAVDELVNLWIGQQRSAEAKVLMHTFQQLFDWSDIVLLGLPMPTEVAEGVRRQMVGRAARRLRSNDPLVSLEALRVINRALHLALLRQKDLCALMEMGDTPGGNLFELTLMVGELGRELATRGGAASPQATELSRFFALLILLVGKSGLGRVRQVYSEAWLNSPQINLNEALLEQLDALKDLNDDGEMLIERVRRFTDDPPRPDDESTWPQSEDGAEAVVQAQRKVLERMKALCKLGGDLPDWGPGEFVEREFKHSLKQIKHMEELRGWVHALVFRKKLANDLETGHALPDLKPKLPEGYETWPAERVALELCNIEERLLQHGERDLFEPEATQFRTVLQSWKQSIHEEIGLANDIIRTLETFNRHVYRTSADSLLSNVTDHAMQVAPIWLMANRGKTLRERLLDALHGHPLVVQMLEGTQRVVDSTHLATTLLMAAAKRLDNAQNAAGDITLVELYRVTKDACRREELVWKVVVLMDGDPTPVEYDETKHKSLTVKGGSWLWPTVMQELATNVRRYAAEATDKTHFTVAVRASAGAVTRLWAGGGRPFWDTLSEKKKKSAKIRANESWKKSRKKKATALDGLARRTADAHERMAATEPQALSHHPSGMGLHMLSQIFKLVGLTPAGPRLMRLPGSNDSAAALDLASCKTLAQFADLGKEGRLCFLLDVGSPS